MTDRPPPSLRQRSRNAAVGVMVSLVLAWLVYPLVGLLSSWLMLPADFEPLAVGLLFAIVAFAGLAGWFFDPDPEEDEEGSGPSEG